MKIVFLDAGTMGDVSMESIAALGEFVTYSNSTEEESQMRVSDCDVLIVNKIKVTPSLLDLAPKLKLVCVAATGVNNIDLDACKARGIEVRNAVGYSTESVVQTTFAHLLSLANETPYFDERVKNGNYSRSGFPTDVSRSFRELSGKAIGIIGMGNIGHRVAQVAEAFGMKVAYYSTSGTSHCADYPSLCLDELLESSDVVSVHAPLNERTRGLIGERELAKMKKSAFILNAGRGGIIDEAALARAVDEEWIAGAALDVFVKEPLLADSPLLHTSHPERFRFSPHVAWASIEARERLVAIIVNNIVTYPPFAKNQ